MSCKKHRRAETDINRVVEVGRYLAFLVITFFLTLSAAGGEIIGQESDSPSHANTPQLFAKGNPPGARIRIETTGGLITRGPIYEAHPYYYDGTFKAITNQIPSLADLGIKTLYLLPIFEHRQSDRPPYTLIYYIQDYQKLDPVYGTGEDLKTLVTTAHNHGMRVLFDLVTIATPPGSIIWNNGWTLNVGLAELKKSVPDLAQTTIEGETFVYRPSATIPGFFDVFGRLVGDSVILHSYPHHRWGPAVDRARPEVIEYFSKVAAYYVKEYDIDGWRVDAPKNNWNPSILPGDHSILELLRSVQAAIVAVKPGAVLYGESPFLIPGEDTNPSLDEVMDASYSYAFSNALGSGSLRTSESLVGFLSSEMVWFDRARSRFTETHDSARTSKERPQLAMPMLALASTIPGIPMIQAGQEIGASNDWFHQWNTEPPSPDAVDPRVDWAHGNEEMRAFARKVFSLRERHEALGIGSIADVWKSGDNTFAYARKTIADTVIVVINFDSRPANSHLSVPIAAGVSLTDGISGEIFTVYDPSRFEISVPAYGVRILVPATPVNSVEASPVASRLAPRQGRQFQAAVSGGTTQDVLWSVEAGSGGTITATGFYTAPTVPGIYYIRATSVEDGTKFARATITVGYDVNADSVVDGLDLGILADALGINDLNLDLNGDGLVTDTDLLHLLSGMKE